MEHASLLLEVENLSVSFGGLVVLNGINLEIKKGEVCAIIGLNGSGKTTLINVLSGFLKPDSGTVKFKGKKITTNSSNHD